MSLKFSRDDVISQLQLHRAPLHGAIKKKKKAPRAKACSTDGVCGIVGSDFKKSVCHCYRIPNPGVVVDFADAAKNCLCSDETDKKNTEAILLHCSALNKDNLTTMYYM